MYFIVDAKEPAFCAGRKMYIRRLNDNSLNVCKEQTFRDNEELQCHVSLSAMISKTNKCVIVRVLCGLFCLLMPEYPSHKV